VTWPASSNANELEVSIASENSAVADVKSPRTSGRPFEVGNAVGRQWQPGQSGNPGGRPKILAEVRDLARTSTVEAIETIRRLMLDEKVAPATRLAAAEALLDRGWGKPSLVQPADLDREAWRVLSDEVLDQVKRYRCTCGQRTETFVVAEKMDGATYAHCRCGGGSFELTGGRVVLGRDTSGPW